MAPPLHYIVFDIETQKSFKDIDRSKLHRLKVSVAGLYDSGTDSYEIYEEKEVYKIDEKFRSADVLVGFNCLGFDLPILAPYLFTPVQNFLVVDLMEEIQKVRGHRVTLQSVAEGTLNIHKTGDGLGALEMYQEGRMEELKKYCLDDVRLTKEIYEYGAQNEKIYFVSNRDWQTHEVPVKWGRVRPALKPEPVFPTSLF
jgi:DEAD/DEAH box helicase domain-containing protein